MSFRGDEHLLQPSAIALLDAAAPGQLGLGLAEPDREAVSHQLELGDAENPGATPRSDTELDSLARERGGEQLAQPALEHRDLPSKLVPDAPFGRPVGA